MKVLAAVHPINWVILTSDGRYEPRSPNEAREIAIVETPVW